MEVVIAVGIMVISISASAGMLLATERAAGETLTEAQAISLAEEGISASISIRDRDWNSLAVGVHGLAVQPSPLEWVFQGSSDAANGFTRTVTVTDVNANMRKVVSSVAWTSGIGRTAIVEEQILLTNWASL